MIPIDVLNKFFEARDVVHFLHFNTKSYAEHKALGEFYEKWLDLADDFIETYQGRYVRIEGMISISGNNAVDCVEYITSLRPFIMEASKTIILPTDVDLQNILADMLGLVNHTLYLLTLK